MPTESLTIRPEPTAWPALIRQNTSPQAQAFRRELGLPTDRALIVSGHHTEFWHPGVVAKYLAADAAAGRTGAGVVWLMVDQDRAESATVRYPVLDADARLFVREITLSQARPPPAARTPRGLTEPDFIASGLDRIGQAMTRHAAAPSFVHQITAALLDLLRPYLTHRPDPSIIFASRFSQASLFRDFVARMAQDPEACCRAYNVAVARHPRADVRPLVADEIQDRFELPLWHLPPGAPRRHVYAEDLPAIPIHELAPKALFMTGLFRLAGCDLFIHGLGAAGTGESHEGYEFITAEWLKAWLGTDALAPITLITTSRYLPLPIPDPPTPAAVARSIWLAHSAPHNPHIIRDGYFDDAKRRLVLAIAAAPHDPPSERAHLYRQLHTLLTDYRTTHAADLDAIRQEAAAAKSRLTAAPIAHDRTWPFPLYPDSVLQTLRDEIAAAFRS